MAAAVLTLAVGGCASVRPQREPVDFDYRSRAISRSQGGVRVSTSVLSADESLAVYGVPLATRQIQPVWIEVENRDEAAYWLMSPGLDPNFFPASEAADAFTSEGQPKAIEQRFRDLAFHNPIPAGATVSGFVLTNLDEGVKVVLVDLVASGRLRTVSLLNPVPGFRADYHARKVFLRNNLYAPEEMIDYTDDDAFRTALEQLPCCTTNKKGSRNGDPLNLVVVGGLEDAFPALVRRGWRPTEETWSGSVIKMMTSALSGERYRYAPVSPLYVYDRPQDLALQRARDNIHQRNHLRLWLTPMRFRGKPVWVGQISRDIGSRLTIHSPYLTTHKIDPDVDEARTALTEDMAYSQNLAAIGFVSGVGAASKDAPRSNLTRDPYYTDGARAVLIFDAHPRSLAEIDFLPWEGREGGFIDQFRQQGGR
ncbi:MAG: LssY C-terminal domain-containing protein [Gammaproteobacteria bacterium]